MCKPRSEFIFCGEINVNFLMDSNQNFIDVLKNETWENIYPMNHIDDILRVFLKTFF